MYGELLKAISTTAIEGHHGGCLNNLRSCALLDPICWVCGLEVSRLPEYWALFDRGLGSPKP